ncbi:hypothetical protein [Vibrio aestuarianus]|uniref:Uncharacterized protein n=1 Tax=Vibrio aestuarianus TaxID=28171 RepID=A0ABN8TMV5_9VIBR|nr:hypothetical protein [Vibrio aestuarianus]MDE1213473.1 hypothetical protein [Vibrio aestuarianus]MDE1219133.1 hypothetical protein [Vibrio aestuarianus]MDE1258556.1 hypothetical protein [Vibrio aestuarianus]MDE1260248.1 hypothetical protein [Vibrio aestuarianus]MDE1266822.1 hypothetical protein [Vibrio aestuarianus]
MNFILKELCSQLTKLVFILHWQAWHLLLAGHIDSIDLLEKYGYVYSRDLTKITPTGIHLMYIKAMH